MMHLELGAFILISGNPNGSYPLMLGTLCMEEKSLNPLTTLKCMPSIVNLTRNGDDLNGVFAHSKK